MVVGFPVVGSFFFSPKKAHLEKKFVFYFLKLSKVICWNRAGRLVVAGEADFEFRSQSYGTKNSRSPAGTMLSAQVSEKTLDNFSINIIDALHLSFNLCKA